MPALTLAKAVITSLAVFLLITARRRSWPIWAMVLAWLPALLVLGGRMYVRPETLSLLYLSIYLAVLCRWDRFPALAWLLPFVQVAWVNSQGLFVLGPILLGFALVDAALRRGAFAPERRRWWQTVVAASAATGLACLLNPYGIHGAIYPLELAGTMSNPIFSRSIAELTPIPLFIQKAGLANLSLLLHLGTMILGALSFLLPIFWLAWVRLRGPGSGADEGGEISTDSPAASDPAARARGHENGSRPSRKKRKKKGEAAVAARRARRHLADQPVPAPPLRGIQLPELAGDPQQPPVRGRGRHGDGLELRRVGLGPAESRRTPTRRSRRPAA